MTTTQRPALFLDRDGVVNVDYGFVATWDRFDYVDGVVALVKAANAACWPVVIVTNQSGIARGYFSEMQMMGLHERVVSDMALAGARIDAIYHCPYLPGCALPIYDRESQDRKPRPGMFLKAAFDLGIDLERSAMIGDRQTDMEAARAAGVDGHLFTGGDLFAFASTRIPFFKSRGLPAANSHSRSRRLPASGNLEPVPPPPRAASRPR